MHGSALVLLRYREGIPSALIPQSLALSPRFSIACFPRMIASFDGDKRAIRALVGLMRDASARQFVILLALMVIAAFAESIGIMLLVPLLSAAGKFGPISSPLSEAFAWLGLTDSLPILLSLFVALVALRALLQYVLRQARDSLEFAVVDALRENCFSGLMNAEWRWMAGRRASDFSALLITNIGRVGSGLTSATEFIATLLVATAYLVTALVLSWKTALVVGIGGAVVIIGFSGLRRRVTELGHSFGRANRAMHQQVQEGVAAIRMTKLTDNQGPQSSAFMRVIKSVRTQQRAYTRQSSLGQAALQIGGAALLSMIVFVGLELWQLPFPILLPLLLVSLRLIPILGSLQQGWQNWLYAVPALAEIRLLQDELEQNAEPQDLRIEPLVLDHELKFEMVSLTYEGRKSAALSDVTFTMKANQTTAIIGASGAGKSSLADILTGLIEPDLGRFTVDGVAISETMRRRWRRSISYVQQDAFLFHASVRANLLWSDPKASEADLKAAIHAAAANFVFALPLGLDTIVGDGGVLLSGGERQRIALARALLRSPALLVLDEATSALDPENEAAILSAIAKMHGNLTVVLIGHRLAFLDQADQVIELQNGKIVRSGLPVELGS